MSSLTANVDISSTTGLEGVAYSQETKVILFPNPVSDILTTNTEVATSKIYSIFGKLIDSYNIPKHCFDVSNYAKGIYIIQAELSSGDYSMNYFIKI